MKFFHLSVRLTNEKLGAFVCPFDKPIKSLYFRSFVVSVLFARFHFKVIRNSLYPIFVNGGDAINATHILDDKVMLLILFDSLRLTF